MFPVIHLMGFHIPMYGLMMALGGAAYVVMFLIITKKEGVDRISKNRLLFISIIGAVVLYVCAFFFNSVFHSIEEGEFVIGGITWLGGIIGIIPYFVFAIHKFVPKAKGNALMYFSMLVPGIVLGHAFGRMGCFLGGCCYGKPTDSIFGVVFPEGSNAAEQYPGGPGGGSQPVLPTQLFEAAFELALFIVMMACRKKTKYYNVEIYMLAYSVFRFGMEFLRGDDRGITGFFLTPAQFFCIVLVVFGVLSILFRKGIIGKKLNARCAEWRAEAEALPEPTEEDETDPLATLDKLYELKEKGVITEEEFNEKKEKIMREI